MDFFTSSDFKQYVPKLLEQNHVPGLSIGIIHDDQEASAGFGFARRDTDKPCTSDTLFEIASCSKSITATCIALLIEDDRYPDVQYDACMHDLLPDDFVMSTPEHTAMVTVDDVLGHRTGMAPHNYAIGRYVSAKDVVRKLRDLEVAAPPRTRYLYNNMMYTALIHLIEAQTGQHFVDFLQQQIFTPLDMMSTCLFANKVAHQDVLAIGHVWSKNTRRFHGLRARDGTGDLGASCVVSSVRDFLKYIKALLLHHSPLNEQVCGGLLKMRSFINPNPCAKKIKPLESSTFYAAGFNVWWDRGHMVAGHTGTISGFASRFLFMPKQNFGLVIFGNADGAYGVSTVLAQMFMDEILCVPGAERRHKMPASKQRTPGKEKQALGNNASSTDLLLTPQSNRIANLQLKTPNRKRSKRKHDAESMDSQSRVVRVPNSQPSSPTASSGSVTEAGGVPLVQQNPLMADVIESFTTHVTDSFASYRQIEPVSIEHYYHPAYGVLQHIAKTTEKYFELSHRSDPFIVKLEEEPVAVTQGTTNFKRLSRSSSRKKKCKVGSWICIPLRICLKAHMTACQAT